MDSLKVCLDSFVKKMNYETTFKEKSLFSAWPSLVGESIAANCRIVAIERPTLVLCIYDHLWRQEIQMRQKQIIAKINEYYGEPWITSISLLSYSKLRKIQQEEALRVVEAEISPYLYEPDIVPFQNINLSVQEARQIEDILSKADKEETKLIFKKLVVRQRKKERYMLSKGYHVCPHCRRLTDEDGSLCVSCTYRLYRQKVIKSKQILRSYPYITWEAVHDKIPDISLQAFLEAKRELIYWYINRLYTGSKDRQDRWLLAMLISGKRKQDLPPAYVDKLAERYKAKKYDLKK